MTQQEIREIAIQKLAIEKNRNYIAIFFREDGKTYNLLSSLSDPKKHLRYIVDIDLEKIRELRDLCNSILGKN